MRFFIAVLQLSIILCYDTLKILKSGLDRGPIIERTQEGKRVAKQQPGFREGRPKIPKAQIKLALSLLEPPNNKSYNEVVRMTGISKSTLQRRMREKKASELEKEAQ